MAKRSGTNGLKGARRPLGNQRRPKMSFVEALSSMNRRAHDQANRANRKTGNRELKSVRAAIAASSMDEEETQVEWMRRLVRWGLAAILLPLCWVTMWTLLSRFSHATLEKNFWQSSEFWYFATGALLMFGWFWSGLLQSFFLYLYVLGHELTHAVFVLIFRGKVTDFHVSTEGGYITTNKTNLLIALSPYFVPFWSVVFAVIYGAVRYFADLKPSWDLAFYGVMGLTWTFHMMWTLWMIPRDQPDLKENGTLLSLVIIYFANLLVLVGLLCVAEDAPLKNSRDFAMEWVRHAATWADLVWRWSITAISELKAAGRFQ
jgi:hypothetical protein